MICKYFVPLCGWLFYSVVAFKNIFKFFFAFIGMTLLVVSFNAQNFKIFMKSNFWAACAFGIISKEYSVVKILSYVFFSEYFFYPHLKICLLILERE